jgi:hypothetical protein
MEPPTTNDQPLGHNDASAVAVSAANVPSDAKLLPPVLDAIAKLLRSIDLNGEDMRPKEVLDECAFLKDTLVELGVQFAETNFDCESDEYEPAVPWTLKDSLAVDVDDKGVPREALLAPTLDAVADLVRTMERFREDNPSLKDCLGEVYSLQMSIENLGVTFTSYNSEGEDEDDDGDKPATWKIGASELQL